MRTHLHIIAHRGGSEYAQANSLNAVKTAIEHGAKIIELDLRLTKDRQLVLSHDKIRQGDQLTRLSEVLAILPENVQLDLDLKEAKLIKELLSELAKNSSTNQIIFDTNRVKVLKQIRQEIPDAKLSLSTGLNHDPFNLSGKKFGQFMIWLIGNLPLVKRSNRKLLKRKVKKLQPDSISIYSRLCNPDLVNFCHQLGIKVFVYTVNRPADLPRYLQMGVDGIKTDKPALLEQTLKQIYS